MTMMHINRDSGLLEQATYIASPNADARSEERATDLIVLHNISLPPGQFQGDWVQALFTNTLPADAHPYFAEIHQLKVSSHLYIRRDGQIIQFVPFHLRAWHAGVSSYQGCSACNDFSIGIELEGTDDLAYEAIQYEKLQQVIEALIACYPDLNKRRITGHCDIAPDRKTDPGASFDWQHLQNLLQADDFERC